jgi:hypothetical protein
MDSQSKVSSVSNRVILKLPPQLKEKGRIETYNDYKRFGGHRHAPRNLTITFSNDPATFSMQLKSLAKIPKYVENLTLNFEKCARLTNEVMAQLSKILPEKFSCLKRLAFIESLESQVSASGYQDLAATLKQLKSLEVVKISLLPRFAQPEKELATIFKSIKGMKKLEKLAVEVNIKYNFNLDQLINTGDQVVRYFTKCIQHHMGLTELGLAVDGCMMVKEVRITNLAKLLSRLSYLRKFTFNLPYLKILPYNLCELVIALKPLQFLSSLSLNFPNRLGHSAKICQSTLKSIASLTKLRTLQLNFGSNLSVQTLGEIAATIKQLEHLTSLGLVLSATSFSPRLNQEKCQEILNSIVSLTDLTELSFCLEECNNVTDQVIQALVTVLQRFPGLESLNLRLSQVATLADADLVELAQAIAQAQNLSSCDIDIEYCKDISEQGISELTMLMSKVNSLTKLALQVYGFPITDKYLAQLGVSIGKLTRLTKLGVRFRESDQITPQGINDLTTNFKRLTELAELTIDLLGSSAEVFKYGQKQIQVAVSQLSHLEGLSTNN